MANETRTYSLTFAPRRKKVGGYYFTCSVRVASSGVLLVSRKYEESEKTKRQEALKRGQNYYDYYFPRIGKRALIDNIAFGPGGGSVSLIFTTTDGLYDVKVETAGISSREVAEPEVDIHKLAKDVSDLYDKEMNRQSKTK